MSCDKFVIWRLCAIVVIALLDILIAYIGKILDLIFGISGPYAILSWFVFIIVALALGYAFEKKGIRNMWKSPFDPPEKGLASEAAGAALKGKIPL